MLTKSPTINPRQFHAHSLAALRDDRKLTQKKLAEIIGVRPNMISGWENGEYTPCLNNAFALCAALECRMEDISIVVTDMDL